MRKIGSNQWLKPGVDFEAGDTIFERAKYLGEEEGRFGVYQVFQDLETKNCFNIGGGHLNWLCQQIEPHDVVKLDYVGEEKLEKGKYKGKNTHVFELWIEDGEEDAPARKTSAKTKPASKAAVDEMDELDDEFEEELEEKPKRKKAAKRATRKAAKRTTKARKVEEDDLDELDDLE